MKQSKILKKIRNYTLREMESKYPCNKYRNTYIFFNSKQKQERITKLAPTYQDLLKLYYDEKCKEHKDRSFITGVWLQTAPCQQTGAKEWREVASYRQRVNTKSKDLSYKIERSFKDLVNPMNVTKPMTTTRRMKSYNTQKNKANALYEANMLDVRLLLNGPSEAKLVSNIDHSILESIPFGMQSCDELTTNIFQLHHIKVNDRKSSTKQGADPSALLLKTKIRNNRNNIKELMGTVAVDPTNHTLIHRYKNSGLSNYKNHQWPWCLRSEDNFEYVKRMYKLDDIEYYSFIANLGAEIT